MSLTRWASVLLCFLGSIQTLGVVVGSSRAAAIGWMSAASPLPLVFNRVMDQEYWAADYSIEAKTRTGKVVSMKLGDGDYERLAGPHTVHMAYVLPLALAPLSSDSIWRSPLRYGFCDSRYYPEAFGIGEPVAEASVIMEPKTGADRTVRTAEIRCSP
jgi:hypothetical protein